MHDRKVISIARLMGLSILLLAQSLLAKPIIQQWSSTGGHTENKDGPQDRMYLAKGGDKITFTVKAQGAEKYVWQVNKKIQNGANGNTFVFTVPNLKGIWEIHVEAIGKGGSAHAEWVISTLTKSEAPDFFDYFTDGEWKNRTETDPWGRKLPEWHRSDKRPGQVIVDTSRKVLRIDGNLFNSAYLYAPHGITHGTWKCKVRVTPSMGRPLTRKKGRVTVGFYALVRETGGGYTGRPIEFLGITIATEFQHHLWTNARLRGPDGTVYTVTACNMPLVGAWGTGHPGILDEDSWKDLKIIRTPDGYARFWRSWRGSGLNLLHLSNNDYSISDFIDTNSLKPGDPDPLRAAQNVGVMGRSDSGAKNKHWAEIDCIEIYKDRFILPKKAIYGEYVNSYKETRGRVSARMTRKGIIVDGLDVRLANIARTINKKSLFHYDPNTKTADCYTDLCIDAGAELVLDGETLRMHCATDGEHQIRVRNSAAIILKDSTITSADSHWFRWTFPSEFTPSGGYASVFTGRFIARNSTINNCGGLYFAGPMEVVLDNVKLTNLVEVAYPSPPHTGVVFSNWCGDSGHNHALSFRGHQVCSRLLIKGCKVSAKQDKKITLKFMSMDAVVGNTTIYDSVLENVNVQAKDGYVFYWGYRYPTTLNLVNTRFDRIITSTDKSTVVPRYYLDVKVLDKAGRSVRGAKVSIVNEVDRRSNSLEKILEKAKNWYSLVVDTAPDCLDASETFIWVPEVGYVKQRKIFKATGKKSVVGQCLIGRKMPWYGKPLSETTTGADGHTPLPEDAEHALVLADYALNKTGKKEFTYTITVEKDGEKKVIKGANPGPEWYRPDPNKPTYTITAVLDGKITTEKELKKQGLAGKIGH